MPARKGRSRKSTPRGADSTRPKRLTSIDRGSNAPFALVSVVDRLGAATISLINPDERTAVVRIESVLRSPESLGDLTGAEVTVALLKSADPGERLVLFAEGWMYAESVAVREIARADPDAADDIRDRLRREESERPVRHLRERALNADMIVVGAVRELRPIKRTREWVPPSEHDPDWWVAVVAIDAVAKGRRPTSGLVEAVFANSLDVHWFESPKPVPGQVGVFLLRRESRFDAPKGALVLLDEADIQPREHYDEIRRLVGA